MIWAQACLSRVLGIELPQDGFVGPDTQQAIASFQTEQRLPSTGRLDDNTASALRALCGGRKEGAYREPDYSKEFDDPFEDETWPARPYQRVLRHRQAGERRSHKPKP